MVEEPQQEVLASHIAVAQTLGKGSGGGQTGSGLGREGHGLDGDPSSLGWRFSEMTDLCRFSWVRVEGAPSRLGVALPRISGVWLGFSMVSDRLSVVKTTTYGEFCLVMTAMQFVCR